MLVSSGICFLIALTQTAYTTDEPAGSFLVMMTGWMGMLTELGHITSNILDVVHGKAVQSEHAVGASFTWLANPLYLIALLSSRHPSRTSFYFSMMTVAVMLVFILFNKVLSDEAGHYEQISSVGAGYVLWVASALILLGGNVFLSVAKRE